MKFKDIIIEINKLDKDSVYIDKEGEISLSRKEHYKSFSKFGNTKGLHGSIMVNYFSKEISLWGKIYLSDFMANDWDFVNNIKENK